MSDTAYWVTMVTGWVLALAVWLPSGALDKFTETTVGSLLDRAWMVVSWPVRELTGRLFPREGWPDGSAGVAP